MAYRYPRAKSTCRLFHRPSPPLAQATIWAGKILKQDRQTLRGELGNKINGMPVVFDDHHTNQSIRNAPFTIRRSFRQNSIIFKPKKHPVVYNAILPRELVIVYMLISKKSYFNGRL